MTTRGGSQVHDELRAVRASWGYAGRSVIDELDLDVVPGGFTAIVGPNGCGKSTLLDGLARLLSPTGGSVILDGQDIAEYKARELARRLGLLSQSATSPEGITVADLVARGRYPHQGFMHRWSDDDEHAVVEALIATRTLDLADRRVDELSGGQRQRVWIAMVLAQGTPTVLLDEPTTFLDIAHQIDILELLTDLHRDGATLVAVLHDLNHAARYADHLVVMSEGRIIAQGRPGIVLDESLILEVFGVEAVIIPDPVVGTPLVVPRGRSRVDESHEPI